MFEYTFVKIVVVCGVSYIQLCANQ